MRVEQLGDGTPEVAIVGGVHGDEPAGVHAIEGLLADPPAVERPVKLVVANEAALDDGVRYVEEDLNRSFPGDTDGGTHESRLAAALTEELAGCVTLSLHSTRSHAEPFAVIPEVDDLARRVLPKLPVVAAVAAGEHVEGRLFATAGVIEVECGLQGSARAAENAGRIARDFLAAVGAVDGRTDEHPLPVYRLRRPIPKPDADVYEVFVENFQRVEGGEPFAAADGEPVVAGEPFYPVLLSPAGYDDVFGYAADRTGMVP